MGSRSKAITALIVLVLIGVSSSLGLMQDTGPAATPPPREPGHIDLGRINLASPAGTIIATASIAESPRGVTIAIRSNGDSGLAPGKHGVHIHEVGSCDSFGVAPFTTAGDHFNPSSNEHGKADSDDSHAGDLGNLTVNDDGSIDFEITTREVTLQSDQKNSLDNPGGSTLVIHADKDDQKTDPSGNSGAREACGIIFRSHEPVTHYMPGYEGTPSPKDATPAATPEN